MAEWLATWPVAVASLLVLFLPGVLPAYALGLRGLVAWGSAPLLGGGVIGIVAVVAGAAGVPWGMWPVVAGSVVLAAVALLLRRACGPWTPRVRGAHPSRRLLAAVVLVTSVTAVVLQVRRTLVAVGGPDRVAQTFDTPFHLNSVALVLDRGDASSLHMNLTVPDTPTAFYPGLWHGIVSLVVQLTGTDIAVAANWVSVLVGSVVWVAGLLALARTILGTSPVLLGLVAPLSFAFTQYPNRLFSFGLLYPNFLSYAVLPAALALCVLALVRRTGPRRLPPAAGALLGMVTLVLAQPNGLFALWYVVVPVVVTALVQTTGRLRRRGRGPVVAALPAVLTVVGAGIGYWALGRVSMVDQFREKSSWEVTASWRHAAREVLDLTAMHPSTTPNFPEPENLAAGVPNLVVAGLVVLGAVVCLTVARWRWLPFSYGIVAVLYVVVRGVDSPLRPLLTGYWYADPQRISALLPLLGVPLAVVGAGWAVTALLRLARVPTGPFALHPDGRRAALVVAAVTVVLAVAVSVLLPRTATMRESFAYVSHVYRVDPSAEGSAGLLDADEIEILETVAEVVPEGVAVVGNPWDGSSLTWALAGRESVFPHTGIRLDEDRLLVAGHLRDALTDPSVCEAVEDLDVGYVMRGGRLLWGTPPAGFEGLDGLVEAGVGELVAQEGDARLYRITACGLEDDGGS
ncbi:DUF6541 family protein [Cellulosimicrobium cellulans]|uniref:DUF6541 family protein n=1 Tax=Cellulosimicrobium cellulans TaxID=1710 RepID=UPI002097A4BD|nr:DUF6541 family protein [Cellulosimicrobium cellulans]MCO7274296.1 hypothetical protein [Cellulosimicrobium cellulans]